MSTPLWLMLANHAAFIAAPTTTTAQALESARRVRAAIAQRTAEMNARPPRGSVA